MVFENSFNPIAKTTSHEVALANSDAKKRQFLLRLAILVPTCLWFFNGLFIVENTTDLPFIYSILTGFFCSLIVFIVEFLIAESKSRSVFVIAARISLAIAISLLGTCGLELKIHESEVENALIKKSYSRRRMLEQQFDSTSNALQTKKLLEGQLEASKTNFQELQGRYLDEVQGRNGRPEGDDKVAQAIDRQLNIAREGVSTADSTLKRFMSNQHIERQKFVKKHETAWGLQDRLAVLQNLVFESVFSAVLFFATLGVLLSLDLLVIFVKYMEPESLQRVLWEKRYNDLKNR